jgi:hypothetical protein
MGQTLMCFYSDHIMVSDKGYEWSLQSEGHIINECAHLHDVSLFLTRSWGGNALYVSQTGETFTELVFEEGNWQHFAANEHGTLCVYSPNLHETFLRSGNYICQPKV